MCPEINSNGRFCVLTAMHDPGEKGLEMKKYFVAPLFCAFALTGLFAGPSFADEAAKTIGVVDYSAIYKESTPALNAVKRLEKLQSSAVAKLETLQKALEEANKANDEAKKEQLSSELQALVYQLQGTLQSDQEHLAEAINAALGKTLEEYRAANNILVILSADTVKAYAPDVNITAEVMNLFNKVDVDFGPEPTVGTPAAQPEEKAEGSADEAQPEPQPAPAVPEAAPSDGTAAESGK